MTDTDRGRVERIARLHEVWHTSLAAGPMRCACSPARVSAVITVISVEARDE